ncbi:MAG: LPS export ABC transporter permease LptG [Rhodobacteraceae bacterium]|jgi:lipopolysaccharide export system permease protein|uniref:Lipopolysaccharide export system permease protein n=1 Tax=Salipiger profundus TaxID=1229727 RepID=A0A1U7DAG1_9RHOB|nr:MULTISPECIES: LPS export ABC transporter permease LptG [Salipiger]APX25098.1 lipopolysaccharide export system permease protein [Salipiger profundus]MAB05440.1 LPS export ABC transporter permease LptG [Paracoccaceae bacterium]GGA15317.1 LPS export ABC transporter permease LptG [Salipiger profundus]SFD10849.1 lipopolysaccharide export system permease protein [Salipiger profundus]
MILHRYFARRFFWVFMSILGIFALFMGLVDFVEQLRQLGGDASFGQVVQVTLLRLPEGMYEILPLVMILATASLFLMLARSSELVVVRAAGRSGLAALMGPVMVALVISGITVAMLNPLVAATSKRASDLSESYESGGASVLSIGREGLWLRQGGPRGQTVIRADSANPDATVLYDVSFIAYAPDGGPIRRIEAAEAQLEDGAWVLHDAKAWPLSTGINPETGARTHAELRVESDLTQDGIRDRFGKPSAIPIWDLPAFIAGLEEAGFSARRHQVWFQMELARPIFLIAMVLVAAGFTMRPARLGRTGLYVLAAVLLGFGLYYVRNFAQIMGENGQLPPILAAWTPPVASLLLALGLVLQMEDG